MHRLKHVYVRHNIPIAMHHHPIKTETICCKQKMHHNTTHDLHTRGTQLRSSGVPIYLSFALEVRRGLQLRGIKEAFDEGT
jgi:hypothetical protein